MTKKRSLWLLLPLYLLVFFLIVGPMIYIIFLSFMTQSQSFGVDMIFTLKNYADIFSPFYLTVFYQSFQLALISVLVIILLGYPFGYMMARLKRKHKKVMLFLLMLPFWTSGLIRLYGWVITFRSNGILDQILMTLHLTDEPLKLLYSYPSVVLGMVYALLPFMILSVYSSVEKMNWSLVEAAKDLGASRLRAFWDITFKTTISGLLSGIVLTFIPSMGLFFIAEILGGNKIVLVGNVIQDLLSRGSNQPLAAAISVVLMLLTGLTLVLYRLVSRTKKLELV